MARPTQCSGSGWVAGRPVGSLGRTPTTGQKQLRGKNGKSCHGRQYKKDIDVHNKQGWNNKRTITTTKKKENKEIKKTKSEEEKHE